MESGHGDEKVKKRKKTKEGRGETEPEAQLLAPDVHVEHADAGVGQGSLPASNASPHAAPPTPGTLLYIGGLPFSYSEVEVRNAFTECGEIEHIHCMRFPDSGKFRGIALVTFATLEGAEKAKAWDGVEWEGRFLVIKPGKALPKDVRSREAPTVVGTVAPDERPKPVGSTTAYVGNLNFDTTEAELKSIFSECPIAGMRFATDKMTGRPKGVAFVEFDDVAALERAMTKNGHTLRGRPLAMHYSTTTGPSAKRRATETVAVVPVEPARRKRSKTTR